MRFNVIGAGAVGCYYGGRLAAHGDEVNFLFRSEYDHVKRHGVRVASIHGDFSFMPNAYLAPSDMPKADIVIVALKSTHTHLLKTLLPPMLTNETLVLSIQNGIGNEDAIAELVGPERVIAGSAFICSERTAPGVVAHTAEGAIRFGWFTCDVGRETKTLDALAAVFNSAGVKCVVNPRGMEIKWTKLVWNVAFNGLSIYYGGITTQDLLADPKKEEFARALMDEVIRAAETSGIAIDKVLVEHNLVATKKMGAYRTSMTVDFLKGRELEVRSIVEEPLRRGEAAGASLPRMRELLRGINERILGRDLKSRAKSSRIE